MNDVFDDDEAAAAIEDKYYPAGVPYPANGVELSDALWGSFTIHKLPLIYLLCIFFCCLNITMYTQPETKQMKAAYIITLESRGKISPWRTFNAYIIFLMRFNLLWFFYDVCGRLMGASDGPFNIILNSLVLAPASDDSPVL